MKIKIEEAKRKDINSILELNKELADFHVKIDNYYKSGEENVRWVRKWLLKNLGKRNLKIFVAKDGNKIIGYFTGEIGKPSSYTKPRKIGKMGQAFISEKYQRKGLGKRIFKELVKWFRANKIKYIELSVDSRNKIGVNTWKKYGFSEYQKKMRMDL